MRTSIGEAYPSRRGVEASYKVPKVLNEETQIVSATDVSRSFSWLLRAVARGERLEM